MHPDIPKFRWPEGKRAAVSLTWDDARASQADIGIPLLDEFGIKGTYYVLPRNVEKRPDSWKAAASRGHEIGNHTVQHPCSGNFEWQSSATMLETYTLDKMEREIVEANRLIEDSLNVKPTSFGYCCGLTFVGRGLEVRSYVPLIAKHFLVGRCYLNELPNIPSRCDLAQVCGMGMDNRPFEAIRARIDATVEAGGWAALVGHEVGQPHLKLNTETEVLRRLCEHLAGRPEIWTGTISEVGRHVAAAQAEAAGGGA